MKYMIYEDALTHRFAFVPLPNQFVGGDELPAITVDRWFDTYEAAIAALPELFNLDERGLDGCADATVPVEAVIVPITRSKPH